MESRAAIASAGLADPDEDVAAFGELDGVADQVPDHLTDTHGIADDSRGHRRVDVANELEAFLMCPHGERLEHVADRASHREGHRFELELARFDLGEVEDVVQDGKERLGRGANGREMVHLV